MNEAEYQKIARRVFGFEFKNFTLLETALTHRSWLNEQRKKRGMEHNERLEFLGDAVLELVVTHYLYATYPDKDEGTLTNWRSALVRTESIGAAASKMDIWESMHLSRGEKNANDRAQLQIMANTFEALVGAVYLDQGYKAANVFIEKHIVATLQEILDTGSWQDAKSRFQEEMQATEGVTPNYKVISETGPDHEKIFTVGVFIHNEKRGEGTGPSKQIAQQAAAEDALRV